MIPAYIVAIGDELLYGQTLNTNAYFLSQVLSDAGFEVIRHLSIADDRDEILETLQELEKKAKVVLLTGGLGPTKDDITKKTFAEYFGVGMKRDEKVLQHIENLFLKRGRMMNELNKSQADLPQNCQVMHNAIGTAPGMWFEKGDCVFVSMPGVPHETKTLIHNEVMPRLVERFKTPTIMHHKIQTIAVPESILAQTIEKWEDELPEHIRLAYLPRLGQVTLRLTARGEDKEKLQKELEEQTKKVLPLIQDHVYGYGDIVVEDALAQMLKEQNLSLAVAESCTGGRVAQTFTRKAGASAFFQGGVVAYSNEVKKAILGVNEETLMEYGAVSEQVALQMAEGVREKLRTDIGIATTGVAGPDGGSEEKPVGTVWIAYADKEGSKAKKLQLTKDRDLNIKLSTTAVLNLLRKKLLASTAST